MKEALDLSWVTPQIAVGGRFPMDRARELLPELGIARVVDVRGECCDDEVVLRRHGLELLNLPTEDGCAVSQRMLDDGVCWIRDQLRAGGKVLIHCEYGIGRSALLAVCALADSGVAPTAALTMLKQARWKVSPSPDQLEGFRTWLYRHGIHAPPIQELFDIAYAHLRKGETGSGTVG